jgi:predicted cupin superfamily sugar epimerase
MPISDAVDTLIDRYDLQPHPEGGFYAETYRSDLDIPPSALPEAYDGPRAAGTSILYLLPADARSEWHRVRSDELWLHQGGRALDLDIGDEPDRNHASVSSHRVGLADDAHPQVLVPGGAWQAAEPVSDDQSVVDADWSLVACVVVPGFHPEDFELVD